MLDCPYCGHSFDLDNGCIPSHMLNWDDGDTTECLGSHEIPYDPEKSVEGLGLFDI